MSMNTAASLYESLQQLIEQLGSAIGAAEAHGLLCGLLCARDGDVYRRWCRQLYGEVPLASDDDARLRGFALEAGRQLEDPDFGFRLVLPSDDEPLADRAAALSQWCRGFVAALGLAGRDDVLSERVAEVVEDFVEITRVSIAPEDCGEEDEEAYAELVEYVRVAVLLVNEELRSPGTRPPEDEPFLH